MSSWGDEESKLETKKKLKELSKNPIPKEIILQSLGNLSKTA